MSHGRKIMISWVAGCCWMLAILFGMFGVFCWVQDPFYDGVMAAQGLGSMFSYWAACGSVGMSLVLGAFGLILTRRNLLLLGLVNLAVFGAAAVCLGADSASLFSNRTRSGWVLVVIWVLISVAMFVLWRRRPGSSPPRDDFQEPSDSERQ